MTPRARVWDVLTLILRCLLLAPVALAWVLTLLLTWCVLWVMARLPEGKRPIENDEHREGV